MKFGDFANFELALLRQRGSGHMGIRYQQKRRRFSIKIIWDRWMNEFACILTTIQPIREPVGCKAITNVTKGGHMFESEDISMHSRTTLQRWKYKARRARDGGLRTFEGRYHLWKTS